jgi:glyoxylase-like metal-dependent hydrolase (beta-lactamase superfamily II)
MADHPSLGSYGELPLDKMIAEQRRASHSERCKPRDRDSLGLPMTVNRVIKGVHLVSMGMAHAFLIEDDDGFTLIDAGYPGKQAAVFGAIRTLGRSPGQLRHRIFTPGHPDHIGSAAAIVRETGARTYMPAGYP